jgi:hypothetical protein
MLNLLLGTKNVSVTPLMPTMVPDSQPMAPMTTNSKNLTDIFEIDQEI